MGDAVDRFLQFLRLDAHMLADPRIEELTGCGLLTWVFVLLLTKSGGFVGGLVPKAHVSPRRITRKIPDCPDCGFVYSVEMAEHGLAECLEARLIVDHDEDTYQIPSWPKWQNDPPMSGAERTRLWRERKRNGGDAGDVGASHTSRGVTACDAGDGGDESDAYYTRLDRKTDTSTSETRSRPLGADVRRVFEHWKTDKRADARLNQARRRRIEARLREGYTVEQLCRAIDGAKLDPYLNGDNSQGKRYLGISTVLRDGEQVERLIDLADNPPQPGGRNGAAAQEATPWGQLGITEDAYRRGDHLHQEARP